MGFFMKLLLALVLLPFISYADCYMSLSHGQDSYSHKINVASETSATSLNDVSRVALKKLFKINDCSKIYITDFKCNHIIKEQPESEVCYVRSNIGYFIISQDYLENINIVFNRFD